MTPTLPGSRPWAIPTSTFTADTPSPACKTNGSAPSATRTPRATTTDRCPQTIVSGYLSWKRVVASEVLVTWIECRAILSGWEVAKVDPGPCLLMQPRSPRGIAAARASWLHKQAGPGVNFCHLPPAQDRAALDLRH